MANYISCATSILIDLWWSPIHLVTLQILLNFSHSKNTINVMSYVEGYNILFIIIKSLLSYLVTHPSIQLAVQSNDLPGQLSIDRYKLELGNKLIKAKGVHCTRTFPAEHDGRHYVV